MEPVIISQNYKWHEEAKEFENVTNGSRYPDTSYDAKISVYEDRVQSWFLQIALDMVEKGQSSSDYVALSIALASIEGVEQYRHGSDSSGQSRVSFIESAKRIFTFIDEKAFDRLWKEARCGLFHSGFTNGSTYLDYRYPLALEIQGNRLCINPLKFVQAVVNDFSKYIDALRADPSGALAENFAKLWNDRWENS